MARVLRVGPPALRAPVGEVADPWITLAAMATATERSGSARWSPRSPGGGPTKVAGRPRRWTGSAADGSRSASAWAATSSRGVLGDRRGLDARRRAGCSTSRSRPAAAWSGEPVRHRGALRRRRPAFLPRPVQRPGCRSGSRALGTPGRCAGPPGRRVLPGRPRPPGPARGARRDLRRCARSPAGTSLSPTTSPSGTRPGRSRSRTQQRARPGGWSSSRGMQYRSTRCAL